jgi:hypothetical protein
LPPDWSAPPHGQRLMEIPALYLQMRAVKLTLAADEVTLIGCPDGDAAPYEFIVLGGCPVRCGAMVRSTSIGAAGVEVRAVPGLPGGGRDLSQIAFSAITP